MCVVLLVFNIKLFQQISREPVDMNKVSFPAGTFTIHLKAVLSTCIAFVNAANCCVSTENLDHSSA